MFPRNERKFQSGTLVRPWSIVKVCVYGRRNAEGALRATSRHNSIQHKPPFTTLLPAWDTTFSLAENSHVPPPTPLPNPTHQPSLRLPIRACMTENSGEGFHRPNRLNHSSDSCRKIDNESADLSSRRSHEPCIPCCIAYGLSTSESLQESVLTNCATEGAFRSESTTRPRYITSPSKFHSLSHSQDSQRQKRAHNTNIDSTWRNECSECRRQFSETEKNIVLPGGELYPGLPRDRRVY